jgi:cation/acetate symporter
MIKGKFIDNLPKVYGIYTGGFIGFIILMAIGEQMGMSAKAIGVAFVAFTIFIYALIGYLSRTAQADAYYVAGRQVPNCIQRYGDSSRLDVWCFIRCNGRWYLL